MLLENRLNKVTGALILLWSGAILFSCAQPQQEAPQVEIAEAELVLIPGGEFLMGDTSSGDHSPVHSVWIDSFYIDKYEVTNAQYQKYCEETDAELPEFWGMEEFNSGPDFPNHPVVGISCLEAKEYAEWRGMRLPTEAEWEYAARGGLVGKKYPHGDELDSTLANHTIKGVATGLIVVGSYPPNGFGLHDMAGNVVEWTADFYDKDYYQVSPERNPSGPEDGKFRVIRGGGWHSGPYCNRVYFRNALRSNWRDFNVGFRCVRGVQPPGEDRG